MTTITLRVRRPVSSTEWLRLNPRLAIGGAIILGLTLLSVLAPVLAPYPPDQQALVERLQPPGPAHLFGTDHFGRDILSRAIWASRLSLSIALLSVAISTAVGVIAGGAAGYFGGWTDNVIMRLVDIMLAFPTFFLLIMVLAAFGNRLELLVGVIGLTSWQVNARVVRAEVLSLRTREFVEAARVLGVSDLRLMVRHLLPNLVSVIVVSATIRIALNILLEAGLSFLGLGVLPPLASWGNMVSDGRTYLKIAWWITMFPGAFILFTTVAFNLLGDGLRDAFDPRRRGSYA